MFDYAAMLFLFAESPLHPGSGSSATAIDLPIQRESHTNLPLNQSSGLKGALRDECRPLTLKEFNVLKELRKRKKTAKPDNAEYKERKKLEEQALPWEIIFGPDTDRAGDHGGCIAPSDARLLLFPVRSVQGVFAWITCPLALARFERDLRRLGLANSPLAHLGTLVSGTPLADENCLVTDSSHVAIPSPNGGTVNRDVVLEDFSFQADDAQPGKQTALAEAAKWLAENCLPPDDKYFQDRMRHSIVVVSDTVFRDFTLNSTEVVARNKINDETGVVAGGALWNVENLPSETLLYSMVPVMRPANIDQVLNGWGFEDADVPQITLPDSGSVAGQFTGWINSRVKYMQIGGDQTIGRGFVSVRCLSSAASTTTSPDPPVDRGHEPPDQAASDIPGDN